MNITKTLDQLLAEGHPNVVVAAMAMFPADPDNDRFARHLRVLTMDTDRFVADLAGPDPDVEELRQTQRLLLRRMATMLDLFEMGDFAVPVADLPPPAEIPGPDGAQDRILFLAANPRAMGILQLEKEFRAVHQQLQSNPRFRVFSSDAVTRDSIGNAIAEHKPTIIHFAGHGLGQEDDFHKGGLVLEDPVNRKRADVFSPLALARLIASFRPAINVRLVVLNACETAEHAGVLALGGCTAVGMREEVGDGRAIAFATGFYRRLGVGPAEVEQAFAGGKAEMTAQGIGGAEGVPVLVGVAPTT